MNFGLLEHGRSVRWLVTLGICAALQLPASHGTPVAAAELPTGATLTILADPVQVASVADGTFVDGFGGQSLQAGDVVRTGPSGMALLTFFDGSESQLSSSSQVQIEQADYSPAPQIALLQTDGVSVNRVIPLPPGGSFRTDTPEATGLVRGTSYVVSIGSDDSGASATSVVLLTDRDGHVGHVQVVPAAATRATVDLVRAGDLRGTSGQASQLKPDDLAQLESAAKDLHDVESARKAHAQVRRGLENAKHGPADDHESAVAEAHERDKDKGTTSVTAAASPSPAAPTTSTPSAKTSTPPPSPSGKAKQQGKSDDKSDGKSDDKSKPSDARG